MVWVLSCFMRLYWVAKALGHLSHRKGLSPVWDIICLFKRNSPLYGLPHTWHATNLRWTLLRCVHSSWPVRKTSPQSLQERSAGWIFLICCSNFTRCLNVSEHFVQLYNGLGTVAISPWLLRWILRLFLQRNLLGQNLQANGASSPCVTLCSRKSRLYLYFLLHLSHENNTTSPWKATLWFLHSILVSKVIKHSGQEYILLWALISFALSPYCPQTFLYKS